MISVSLMPAWSTEFQDSQHYTERLSQKTKTKKPKPNPRKKKKKQKNKIVFLGYYQGTHKVQLSNEIIQMYFYH